MRCFTVTHSHANAVLKPPPSENDGCSSSWSRATCGQRRFREDKNGGKRGTSGFGTFCKCTSLRPGVDGRLCTAGLLFIRFISIKVFDVSSVWNHIHKLKSFGPTVTGGMQRVTYVLHRQLRSKRSVDAFLLHNAKGQRARSEISDGLGGMLSCQALRETHPAAMEPQQVQFDIWDGDLGVFPKWTAFRSSESGIQPRADLCNKCVSGLCKYTSCT